MSTISTYQRELFNKLLDGELSPQDTEVLLEWLASDEMDPATAELIISKLKEPVAQEQVSPDVLAALEHRMKLILTQEAPKPARRFILNRNLMRYAAAVLLLIAVGSYFLIGNKSSGSRDQIINPIAKTSSIDIPAGKDGAILTLADNTVIVLDSMGNGIVASQNGTSIVLKNGQLFYNASQSDATELAYNTITTTKGRQFHLTLPDGSEVWLNAASSLRFPTVFVGKERKVEVSGEAYFEVKRNPGMPFKVQVNNETAIEVLGTRFNVNSYRDETTISTTLLEGSVKISKHGEKIELKPGQQAQISYPLPLQGKQSAFPGINVVNNVDIEKVVAWKNGLFNFQDATLEEVMRQLERWYDIEVRYEKNIPRLEFYGKMGRDLNLATVLNGLEKSNVHFRMENGRRLVVLP